MITGNPDLEYFGGMTFQAGVLFKQARERGYQGMFMSDDGFDSSDATKIAGQALLNGGGTCYSTVSGTAAVYPGTANFIQDFKAKFKADPQPLAVKGYDFMAICVKAMENAAKGQEKRSAHPGRGGASPSGR